MTFEKGDNSQIDVIIKDEYMEPIPNENVTFEIVTVPEFSLYSNCNSHGCINCRYSNLVKMEYISVEGKIACTRFKSCKATRFDPGQLWPTFARELVSR